ncbi:hypothetical protein K440DRAFT_284459 [Wilcoxina mikolae CBS 423.85]|nr:hypothetical protein K440DRAFT_284459 [Wilcoxina mikolae CBS 423.85]
MVSIFPYTIRTQGGRKSHRMNIMAHLSSSPPPLPPPSPSAHPSGEAGPDPHTRSGSGIRRLSWFPQHSIIYCASSSVIN